jgi:phage I-like protein
MPLQECQSNGKGGWRWGESGRCYTGPGAKKKAIKQGLAIGDLPTGADVANTMRGSVEIAATKIDAEGRSWIEVMPTAEKARNGRWYFTITAEDLDTLAAYIGENPNRIPIDRDHGGGDGDTRAAGWFTGEAIVVRENEKNPDGGVQERPSVWAEVKWTPTAVQEIRDGDFRFISPEWAMAETHPRSGLMTKLKELGAATLTNRPFFEDLAAVTARDLLDAKQLNGLADQYGSDFVHFILAGLGSEDERVQKLARAVLGTDNDPEITQGAEVELKTLAVKLGLPEDADEETVLAKLDDELKDSSSDDEESDEQDEPEQENTMAEKVTDYLKILGLDETADPQKKINAALNDKDGQILALEENITTLTAKVKESEKLNERIEDLERRDRSRDIEVFLAKAVEKGRVLPVEKDKLADLFADNVKGLKSLIASRPEGFSKINGTPRGSGGSQDFTDDADVAQFTNSYKSTDPVDAESAKLHLLALEVLKEQGKGDDYTTDEYITAAEEARSNLVY